MRKQAGKRDGTSSNITGASTSIETHQKHSELVVGDRIDAAP